MGVTFATKEKSLLMGVFNQKRATTARNGFNLI